MELTKDLPLTKDDVTLMPETLAQSHLDGATAAAIAGATTAASPATAIPTTVHLTRKTSRKDSLSKFFRRAGPEPQELDRMTKANSLGKIFQKRSTHGSHHTTNMDHLTTPPPKTRPHTTQSEGRKGIRGYFAQYCSHWFGNKNDKVDKRPSEQRDDKNKSETSNPDLGQEVVQNEVKTICPDLMDDITGTIKESSPVTEA